MITRIQPGARMSEAVVHGDAIYLSGQVGEPGDDVATQTRTALAEIEALLAEAGSDKSKILMAQIWLADIADFEAMNGVWDAWVDPANPPARATSGAPLAIGGVSVRASKAPASIPAHSPCVRYRAGCPSPPPRQWLRKNTNQP